MDTSQTPIGPTTTIKLALGYLPSRDQASQLAYALSLLSRLAKWACLGKDPSGSLRDELEQAGTDGLAPLDANDDRLPLQGVETLITASGQLVVKDGKSLERFVDDLLEVQEQSRIDLINEMYTSWPEQPNPQAALAHWTPQATAQHAENVRRVLMAEQVAQALELHVQSVDRMRWTRPANPLGLPGRGVQKWRRLGASQLILASRE